MKKLDSNYLKFFLFLFLSILLFGCNTSKEKKNNNAIITVALENDIQTLDPTTLSDPYTSRIVWQMYEGLVGLDSINNPLPLIAESWTSSEHNKVWTFKIRQGVCFHKSGLFKNTDSTRTVNAYDVLYSYNRFAKGFGSFVFSGLVAGFDEYMKDNTKIISGFQAVDSLYFRVILNQPDPSFIYRITSPYLSIMPQEVIENDPQAFGKTISIGTGPFILEKRTETEVYLNRNTNYWRETKGNISKIVFRIEKSSQFRVTKLENGEYNIIQLPLEFVPNYIIDNKLVVGKENKFAFYSATTYNIHYLAVNCKTISDVHLRRAMGFAIDKGAIVNNLLHGQAVIANSPIVPGMQGYKSPEVIIYDQDSAKIELQKSKYKGNTIKLYVSDAPNSEQIGQIIQSDLKGVGINIEIIKLDFNTLISRIFSNDRPDLFVMNAEWIYSAPELLSDSYNSRKFPNPNLFEYNNKQVDYLLGKISLKQQRSEINELCSEAESIALREVPAVWLFHQKNIYVYDKKMMYFSVNANNHWNFVDVVYE